MLRFVTLLPLGAILGYWTYEAVGWAAKSKASIEETNEQNAILNDARASIVDLFCRLDLPDYLRRHPTERDVSTWLQSYLNVVTEDCYNAMLPLMEDPPFLAFPDVANLTTRLSPPSVKCTDISTLVTFVMDNTDAFECWAEQDSTGLSNVTVAFEPYKGISYDAYHYTVVETLLAMGVISVVYLSLWYYCHKEKPQGEPLLGSKN